MNDEIRANTGVVTEVMPLEQAREKGAMALFGEKYSEEVRVLTMGGGFSVELCGGTHAKRTGDIGIFRLTSEQGIASGVRRIEGVTGANALDTIEALEDSLAESAGVLRADKGNFSDKIRQLVDQNKKLEKEVSQLNMKLASGAGNDLADSAIEVNGIKLIVNRIDGGDPKTLPDVMDRLKNKIQSGIVVLAAVNENKITLIAGVTQDLTETIQAGALVNHVASQVGGKGGGRPDMARAGGSDVEALPNALDSISGYILENSSP